MSDKLKQPAQAAELPTCGIVMPIAVTDGCDPLHWQEMLMIIKGCCEKAGFKGELVSAAADSGTILRRIVGNLYNSDVVIADVSGKNPNVMFELGMRLAFDKPAIVIKDESTGYSFDTGVIEHIGYPRDLHYHSMIAFQETLTAKITATHKAASDPNYTTFLKHFGEYTAKKLESTEVSGNEIILRNIEELREEITLLRSRSRSDGHQFGYPADNDSSLTKMSVNYEEKLNSITLEILPYIEHYLKDKKIDDPFTDRGLNSYLMSKNPRYAEIQSPTMRRSVLNNALMLV